MGSKGTLVTGPDVGRAGDDIVRRQGAILHGVARATDRLLAAGTWKEALPEALAILGEATGVSRVYLFERLSLPGNHTRVCQTFEWVAPGIEPQINHPDLQDLDLDEGGFARWGPMMREGKAIFGDIHEFPEGERPLLEGQAILSLMVQPVFVGGSFWGLLGFDACERLQQWTVVEVDALRIATLVLGSAVHLEQREVHFRQAHKMEALGRMAGGVAHDFNNMLGVMVGSLDLLRRAISTDSGTPLTRDDPKIEQAVRHLAVIQQVTSQAVRLTRQLVDFSRRRETTALLTEPQIVVDAMSEVLRQVAGHRVELDLDARGLIEPVFMDPVHLEQIVMNLVVNARDAMPNGGVLQVRLRTLDAADARVFGDEIPDGRYTLLSVRDSGHGIPAELRDRVFEPFFSTKDVGHGTGLGLATVYGAVASAGGRLALTSAPGQGTELRVYLPVAVDAEPRRQVVEAGPSTPINRMGRGERIVVCDDNIAFRAWVVEVLEDAGYRVIVPVDAEACLALPELARREVDLLVTDVRMPGIDGPTLRKRMREIAPDLPTVYMSGFAAELLDREREERQGLDPTPRPEAFLDKPFSREQLLDAIATALRASRRAPRPEHTAHN